MHKGHFMSYPPQPEYPQQYGQAPTYIQPVENSDETFGSWLITLIICAIPVVGFIYTCVLAFGSTTSPSRRNWARALLALMLIGVVVTILFSLLFGAALLASLSHMQY